MLTEYLYVLKPLMQLHIQSTKRNNITHQQYYQTIRKAKKDFTQERRKLSKSEIKYF